ncbi:hypothetical protein BDV96DRAFT_646065 [Lophiotrema nucula]|uniref:NACHT-NTPase and P-loop NTPases N-terminal domain-containing protein n=1 Tax=Lophiotrema nucula TaxID=690887 RepID=A0A6A5ZBT5_9PLEO|nr:hypothetical protein BDV96DRAFT_646065 [Lophiotrema nucula]
MAEALATASIIATTIQIFDFSTKVLSRIESYASNTKSLPKVFQNIHTRLPVLEHALRQTKGASDEGLIPRNTEEKIMPLVNACLERLKQLDAVVTKVLPQKDDGTVKRGLRAVGSLRYDSKVVNLYTEIGKDIAALQSHMTTVSGAGSLAAQPKAPPIPSSNVPFRREPHFIHRPIFDQIEAACQQPASRTALVGLGGVGKSQLAIEYTYRVHERSPEIWVFWVHADTKANFNLHYRKIAEKVGIAGYGTSDEEILKRVYEWLSNEQNGQWLIVIDNADERDIFETPESSDQQDSKKQKRRKGDGDIPAASVLRLTDYLPQSQHGHYVITSRDRETAFRLTGSYTDIIPVSAMDETEAVALLNTRFPSSSQPPIADSKELVRELDYMPLAITQAASYVNKRSPRTTVRKYIEELRRGEVEAGLLLGVEHFDLARGSSKRANSIASTWHISYTYIQRTRPTAARLLAHMSLFERSGIPEDLCKGRYEGNPEWLPPMPVKPIWKRRPKRHRRKKSEQICVNEEFEEDLLILTSFFLIQTSASGDKFSMHSLVRTTTRTWLLAAGQFKWWQYQYITLIGDKFPWPDSNNLEQCDKLLPHLSTAMRYEPSDEQPLRAWSGLMFFFVEYLRLRGMYTSAESVGRKTLEIIKNSSGQEHSRTLSCMHQLASTLRHLKQYEASEDLARQVYEARKTTLGPEHADTITSLALLESALWSQGKLEASEDLARQVYEARKTTLGPEHADTITSLDILASALRSQGKPEAVELWQQSLDLKETAFGTDALPTMLHFLSASLTATELKDYAREEAQVRYAVEKRKKWHGVDSAQVQFSMRLLGILLHVQKKYEEAEVVQRALLASKEKVYGKDSVEAFESMTYVADVLADRKKLQEAEELYRKCFEFFERTPGLDHEESLRLTNKLADVLCCSNQLEEAEALNNKVIEQCLKAERTGMLAIEAWPTLAHIRERQGRLEEAFWIYDKAVVIAKEKGFPDTPELLSDYDGFQERKERFENELLDALAVPLETREEDVPSDGLSRGKMTLVSDVHGSEPSQTQSEDSRASTKANPVSAGAVEPTVLDMMEQLAKLDVPIQEPSVLHLVEAERERPTHLATVSIEE